MEDNRHRASGFSSKVIMVVAVIIAAAVYIGYSLKEEPKVQGVHGMPITVATADQPVGAALYIARAKGFFEDEGLAVSFLHHTTGRDALNSVIEGNADLCEVAETPLVFAGLRGIPVSTLVTIASTDRNMAVFARRDRGIAVPTDLVGKKIGATAGTNGEYFLSSYLMINEISPASVEVVNLRPEEMLPMLLAGELDAATVWNPHLRKMQTELGESGITLEDRNIYTWAWNVAAMEKFVAENPVAVEKLIRAIVRAERFIKKYPEESRSVVVDFIGMDPDILTELWNVYEYRAMLEQSLLTSMEAQARWAIRSGLVESGKTPNFLDSIHYSTLKTVDPNAVTIVH